MTREHVDALEERVGDFGSLAEVMVVIAASTRLDADAADVLRLLQRHLVYLTDKLDELTVPARQMLGEVTP